MFLLKSDEFSNRSHYFISCRSYPLSTLFQGFLCFFCTLLVIIKFSLHILQNILDIDFVLFCSLVDIHSGVMIVASLSTLLANTYLAFFTVQRQKFILVIFFSAHRRSVHYPFRCLIVTLRKTKFNILTGG